MTETSQKILGIVGSPRRNGNTEVLVDEVLKGAESAGGQVEKIILNELNIRPGQTTYTLFSISSPFSSNPHVFLSCQLAAFVPGIDRTRWFDKHYFAFIPCERLVFNSPGNHKHFS